MYVRSWQDTYHRRLAVTFLAHWDKGRGGWVAILASCSWKINWGNFPSQFRAVHSLLGPLCSLKSTHNKTWPWLHYLLIQKNIMGRAEALKAGPSFRVFLINMPIHHYSIVIYWEILSDKLHFSHWRWKQWQTSGRMGIGAKAATGS